MIIETTINISKSNKKLLQEYALKYDLSINKLTIKLLIKYLNNNIGNYRTFSSIKYQKRINNDPWKTLHLWLSPDFYEKCLDLRKFHKLSLSNILSQAIKLYLKKIQYQKYDNNTTNYIFIGSVYKKCPIFIITWDYPGNKKVKQLLDIYENT